MFSGFLEPRKACLQSPPWKLATHYEFCALVKTVLPVALLLPTLCQIMINESATLDLPFGIAPFALPRERVVLSIRKVMNNNTVRGDVNRHNL